MDHPANPGFPAVFHVRNDGWMGASLTFESQRTIEPGRPLRLRCGVCVHGGIPAPEQLDRHWQAFAASPTPAL